MQKRIMDEREKCAAYGCENYCRGRDKFCSFHGSKYRTSKEEGCEKWAIGGGFCRGHGGHDWKKICTVSGCNVLSWKSGKCYKHRNKDDPRVKRSDNRIRKVCRYKNCKKWVRITGLCLKHARDANLICQHLIGGKHTCDRKALIGEKRCRECSKL